jgi:hypothetical protein
LQPKTICDQTIMLPKGEKINCNKDEISSIPLKLGGIVPHEFSLGHSGCESFNDFEVFQEDFKSLELSRFQMCSKNENSFE